MNLDLTKKEIAAVGELIASVVDDKAVLVFPPSSWSDAGDAYPSHKGRKLLASAFDKLGATGAYGTVDWDQVFDTKKTCLVCGK